MAKSFDEVQEFEFHVLPTVGDTAPNFRFVDVTNNQDHHLRDYRGKVVLLEFWATWCGPCQPAMEKLVDLVESSDDAWQDRVVVLPVSTDKSMARVSTHLSATGWSAISQFWAPRNEDEYFAVAERLYGIYGIPHSVLIDADGKIAWRGHPLHAGDGKSLSQRIQAILDAK